MNNRLDGDEFGPSTERRSFRAQLIKRMAQQNISSAELSRRAGISKDAVSSYTSMRSLPTDETLSKLAKALKCKPQALLKALNSESIDDTLIEIREYSKPGYKLLVARLPVPVDQAIKLFDQLSKLAAQSKR